MLKPSGSLFVNLGDKYAGSAGWNNSAASAASSTMVGRKQRFQQHAKPRAPKSDIRAKSLMGLPWRYAIGCIDGQADPEGKGWILRSEIVWSKPNGLPESVRDRVRRSHEQWFHFTKEPRYYADMDVVREATVTDPTARPTWEERKAKGEPMRAGLAGAAAVGNVGGMAGNPLGKLPDSVWTIATEPLIVPDWLGVDHFAAFPTEWPRRIISAWCPEHICTVCGEGRRTTTTTTTTVKLTGGADRVSSVPGQPDHRVGARKANFHEITGTACACPDTSAPTKPGIVLDPFGGTGTTAMVARALGRFGVSVDLSADYLRLANWRIFDSGGAAKVRGRDNADRQGVLL